MHSDRPDESDLQAPWLASLPLEPGYQEAALVVVHHGRAAAPAEGLAQVLRFHADGQGGWIAAARSAQGRWGYVDGDGRWRVPPILQRAFSFSSDGLARFCQDGRWGFLDLAGRVAIAPTYDNAQPFRHGVCAVQVGKDVWRIIGRDGNARCSEDFRELGAFGANGLARATPRSETGCTPLQGFVDTAGHWVIPPRLRHARGFGEWPATAASLDGSHHGLIDAQGHWVLSARYEVLDEFNADGLAFYAEYADAAHHEGRRGYVDPQGHIALEGDRHLSRHMACGVVAHQPHGRGYLCADGTPLPTPALSFGTDFSADRGFAIVRTAPQPGHDGAGGPVPPLPAWGLLHPDGRWVPAPAALLEPLTDGDGWLVAPQPDTPLAPFITRDGQMAYVNGEGSVVWRVHYDGQQVALLDAEGALLWRSGVQPNCWPPRPFFQSPLNDHLEGLSTLDGVVPLAHRLLMEAQAQNAPEAAPRRVVHALMSPSHSGPYAFLAAHLEGVVKDAHAALAQRLSARYGPPTSTFPGAAATLAPGSMALGWRVPMAHPRTPPPATQAVPAAPGGGADRTEDGLWLVLYSQTGAQDGETWWDVWLNASSVRHAPAPEVLAAPAHPVPARAAAVEGAAAQRQATAAMSAAPPRPAQAGGSREAAASPVAEARGSRVRDSLRNLLGRLSIG